MIYSKGLISIRFYPIRAIFIRLTEGRGRVYLRTRLLYQGMANRYFLGATPSELGSKRVCDDPVMRVVFALANGFPEKDTLTFGHV